MDTSGYSIPIWQAGPQSDTAAEGLHGYDPQIAGEIIEEMDTLMAERMKELAAEKTVEQDMTDIPFIRSGKEALLVFSSLWNGLYPAEGDGDPS